MRASCHHRQEQQPRRCAACAASGVPQRTERRPGSPGARPCSPDDGRTSRCVARPAPPTAAPRARRLARALPPTSRGRAASGEIPGSSPVPGGRGQPPTQPWTRRQRRRCRCRHPQRRRRQPRLRWPSARTRARGGCGRASVKQFFAGIVFLCQVFFSRVIPHPQQHLAGVRVRFAPRRTSSLVCTAVSGRAGSRNDSDWGG